MKRERRSEDGRCKIIIMMGQATGKRGAIISVGRSVVVGQAVGHSLYLTNSSLHNTQKIL